MPNYEDMTDMGQSSSKKNPKDVKELEDIIKEKEMGKEKKSSKIVPNKSKTKESIKPTENRSKSRTDTGTKSTSTPVKTEPDSKVEEVKNAKDLEARLRKAGNGLVVVDFYATWCIPCKVAAPQLDNLADEMKDVTFLKVDVDENEEIAVKYNVSTMPTFVLIKQGKVVETVIGFNVHNLENLLKKHRLPSDPAESKEKKKEKIE